MAQLFLRTCTLSLSGSGDTKVVTGGGPTDLRLRFNIVSHTLQAPNLACFVITNPSMDTVKKVQSEFTQVSFTAGYATSNSGLIFGGTITQFEYGEIENNVDRILRISVSDGDFAYNNSKVSTTLAAGATPQDIVNACLQAMAPYGVTMGTVTGVDLSQPSYPRAYPLAGMARDYLREVVQSKNATFTIYNNQLNIIAANGVTSATAIQINANTGMLYQPIQTLEGVKVKCLIRSDVTVNGNIQLDPQDVVSPVIKNSAFDAGTAAAQQSLANQLSPTGMYRVLHIEYDGDTRGAPWLMTLTCIGTGGGQGLNTIQAGLGYS